MKNIVVGISFPREIIEKVDIDRGDVPRSRYIWRILEKQLCSRKEREVMDKIKKGLLTPEKGSNHINTGLSQKSEVDTLL